MPSKHQDPAPSISPVLFITVDAEPMKFFLRPGPVKQKLQPLITAGGGEMCRVQQSGAILLIDPEEKCSASSAHRFVSTQYIYDCIEKEEQLNLEDYRLNPDVVQRHSPRLNSSKKIAARLSGGRLAYTSKDDAAILGFANMQKKRTGGNLLWKEMEKQHVTSHSWQSMKSRYKTLQATKQSGIVEKKTGKESANQECDAEKSSCEADVAPAQTHSADSNPTQNALKSVPAGCTPVNEDAQTDGLIRVGKKQNQESDEQAHENLQSETVEVEPSPSSHTKSESLQTSTQLRTAEITEPGRDGSEKYTSPQKQSLPGNSPLIQAKSTPKKTPSQKLLENLNDLPKPEQPHQRLTRRKLELETSSLEIYGKKLRSYSSGTEQSPSSTQISKKTKSPVKSVHHDEASDQPSPKRARGKTMAAEAESQPEQSGHDTNSKAIQDDESNSAPREMEKKKEKRQLGILELATKEFEDEYESSNHTERLLFGEPNKRKERQPMSRQGASPPLKETRCSLPHYPSLGSNCLILPSGGQEKSDEDEVLQHCSETAAALTESQPKPAATGGEPTSAQSNPETGPGPQENLPESQASSDNCTPEKDSPNAAPAMLAGSEPVAATSKAHLFIFDNESQEEDSQSVYVDCLDAPSSPQPTVDKDAAFSLTLSQLEEDKQRIRDLMNQTNQDLVSVTTALLKTSGDFSAALDLLLNPSLVSAPIWNRYDDSLLLSSDPAVHQKLQDKYGEENVAKRIMFLEVEG